MTPSETSEACNVRQRLRKFRWVKTQDSSLAVTVRRLVVRDNIFKKFAPNRKLTGKHFSRTGPAGREKLHSALHPYIHYDFLEAKRENLISEMFECKAVGSPNCTICEPSDLSFPSDFERKGPVF
jgi:hypothetical protein